jgi:hypothetical protein
MPWSRRTGDRRRRGAAEQLGIQIRQQIATAKSYAPPFTIVRKREAHGTPLAFVLAGIT